MVETPVSVEVKAEAAPTPPVTPPLTRFRAVISGKSKKGNVVFTIDNLKAIIETVATLSDAVAFFIDPSGLKAKVLDNARIALVSVELPRSVFAGFEADGEGIVTVDTKSLLAVLRRAKNKTVELSYNDGLLTITVAGTRSFRVRTHANSAVEEIPQPKVNHAVSAAIDVELLKEALVDARVMKADTIKLLAENGVLLFRAVNETKGVEVRLGPAEGSASSAYALDYLTKAIKAFSNGIVEVKFGNNAALELSTAFNEGYIRVYIAPRIE